MPVPQLRDIGVVRLGYAGGVAARILGGYKALESRKSRMSEDAYDRRVRRHHLKSAHRIYRATLRLQGLMIKIGQTLGSRSASRSKKRTPNSIRRPSPPPRWRRSIAPVSTTAVESPSRSSTRTSSASSAPTSGS